MGEACSAQEVSEKCIQYFSRKTQWERPRRRCEDNIEVDIKGTG